MALARDGRDRHDGGRDVVRDLGERLTQPLGLGRRTLGLLGTRGVVHGRAPETGWRPHEQGVDAQGLEATPGMGLDRADRAAEQLRDLGLAQVVPVTQHQHGTLPRRKGVQRLTEGSPLLDGLGVPRYALMHPLGQERRQQMDDPSPAYPAEVVVDQRAAYVEVDVVARDAPPAGVHLGQRGLHEILGLVEVTGEHVRGADKAGPGRGGVLGEVAFHRGGRDFGGIG